MGKKGFSQRQSLIPQSASTHRHHYNSLPTPSTPLLTPSHLFPSPFSQFSSPLHSSGSFHTSQHHPLCHQSPPEGRSPSEWDHNRSSFAFNSQSDNRPHVRTAEGACDAAPPLTPLWLGRWVWTDVPAGAELAESVETGTLMRWWQNSHSPIKGKWIVDVWNGGKEEEKWQGYPIERLMLQRSVGFLSSAECSC